MADRRAEADPSTANLSQWGADSSRRLSDFIERLKAGTLRCPRCNAVSASIRFYDKKDPWLSYFVCSGCGRSFSPPDPERDSAIAAARERRAEQESLSREWYAFQVRAGAELSKRPPVRRRGVHRVLHFTEAPSFAPVTRIDVYDRSIETHGKEKAFCAVITVWRRDVDRDKFRTPAERLKYPRELQPTLEEREVPVQAQWIKGLLEKLANVRLPVQPPEAPTGLDGTSYSLSVTDGGAGMSLGWWCDGPDAWRPAIAIAREIAGKIMKAEA